MEETKNIHSFPGFAKGKRAPLKRDSVKFGDFLTVLPTVPLVDLAPKYTYPMDGNDVAGDCVVAGWDHFRQIVTGLLTGTPKNFTQDEIWAFYQTQNPDFDPLSATSGPGSVADNGMSIQLFLEYLQTQKYILGFAKIDQTNEAEMKAAVYLGLGILTGVVIDDVQMQQYTTGTWDYVPGAAEDGGHCIPVGGFQASPDEMACVTWAKIVQCTQTFIKNQMDEAWFILMQEHVDHPNFRDHFDLAGFSQAVSAITDGRIVIPVTPPKPASMKPQHTFSVNLGSSMTGPEVVALQQCLQYDGEFPADQACTGNFYNITKAAVIAFQAKYNIPETGYVGPLTRAQLNKMFGVAMTLVDAVIQVETGGDDLAVGDENLANHAYGCLQIRQGVVDQVNGHLGTSYKAQDCLGNHALSLKIWTTYWTIFTDMVTDKDKAFAWNGGPGWRQEYGLPAYQKYTEELDAYWAKVDAFLKE